MFCILATVLATFHKILRIFAKSSGHPDGTTTLSIKALSIIPISMTTFNKTTLSLTEKQMRQSLK
jgi:hypothetical protein